MIVSELQNKTSGDRQITLRALAELAFDSWTTEVDADESDIIKEPNQQ